MSQKHSRTPWSERTKPEHLQFDGYFRIVDANGRHVATVPSDTADGKPVGEGRLNLARILACVNACRDFSDEQIQKVEAGKAQLALLAAPDPFAPEIVTVDQPNAGGQKFNGPAEPE